MALENVLNLPDTPTEGGEGHVSDHQIIHEALKEIKSILEFGQLVQVAALPAVTAADRGRIALLQGDTSTADEVYVVVKSATNTYSWKKVTLT